MTRSPAGPIRSAGRFSIRNSRTNESFSNVAKTSPGEFIRQVRVETGRVHWPTRKETIATAIMVIIMTLLLAVFFFGVDAFFKILVTKLLSFVG
jgi:preprotein translocase subunit SecE